ncbi:MAG: tRNA (guanosine(37)-N1)-methyltransferase TrmD [Candidatus Riflebacteria bacterium]|nr:tRNA (guanosine(37)-N1)-methyltransferase TrmD [Candidatus Riflebacteria bacterium]
MRVDIITLLPSVFEKIFDESVLGSAVKSGLIEVAVHRFREYGDGKHRTVDDTPFGGGPGMVFKPAPMVRCIKDVRKLGVPAPVIGLTPQGVKLDQKIVKQLAGFERLILVCGRYEGFDERIVHEFDLQLSIGDYVLTGGEIAAMTVVDAVSRMIPGTVGTMESVEQDSFYEGLLDCPQYTRPSNWQGLAVPEVLLNGNHSHINKFRHSRSMLATAVNRPDVFAAANLTDADRDEFQSMLMKKEAAK